MRYSDVRSGIIDGLANLLQGKGQIVSGGGAGGWAVILDLISSVPLSMASASAPAASESEQAAWVGTGSEEGWDAEESFAGLDAGAQSTLPPTPVASADTSVRLALQVPGFQGSGSMASLATAGVIPQYQWPLESLVSAFTCMKLIVDEFLVVLEPDCELVSSVLHGLALFGSQVKDVNISLTSVEMLWKVTDDAIKYARSNQNLRLSGKTIVTSHYVAVIFDIMLKQLFQLSMDGQPLIRHCAMNTLFSAMSTHAPIISTEQWQQVFGNIIFPLFERAGARSRIAMRYAVDFTYLLVRTFSFSHNIIPFCCAQEQGRGNCAGAEERCENVCSPLARHGAQAMVGDARYRAARSIPGSPHMHAAAAAGVVVPRDLGRRSERVPRSAAGSRRRARGFHCCS